MKKTNKMLTKMLTDSWHRQGSEFQGISRPNKEIKYFSRTLTRIQGLFKTTTN